jgi:tRNA (mo5U34)-methyltransferase
MMNPEELKKEVARIKWWHHQIDLGHGVLTPGQGDTRRVLQTLGMPDDLRGKSVLDIGAWDGFFSFEAERRGASRVLATDSYCWGENPWSQDGFGTKDGFELARRALHSQVEDRQIDVLDLSPEKVGVFDLVLFLGVLYHMRHPLLALERVASVTGHQAIVETHVDMVECKWPVMVFYPGKELADDETNWWGPNPAAVEAMLKTVGFREVKRVYLDQRKAKPPETVRRSSAVFHAWR